MQQGTIISTRGYRGDITDMVYLEPGDYTVSNSFDIGLRTVTAKQAAYIVSIDMAQVVGKTETTSQPEPPVDAESSDDEDDDGLNLSLTDLQNKARANGISYSGKSRAQLIAELAQRAASE